MLRLYSAAGRICFWLLWPVWKVVLPRTTRTRVLILSDNHLLLVRNWLSNGDWALPGGGVQRHESALAAAVREVREETGITLDEGLFRRCAELRTQRHGLSYRYELFVIELPEQIEPRAHLPEITAAAWVPIHQTAGVSPDVRVAVAAWRR